MMRMDFPFYPESRPLELDDRDYLDPIFARLQPCISEFTFANLYLFRTAHSYTISTVGDSPVLFGKGYGGGEEYFLPPLGGDVENALAVLLGEGRALYGADDGFVKQYLMSTAGIDVTEDRDSFDYLHLRQELAELPGNRFHKKKNRINYFTNRHSSVVEPYSEKYLDGSLHLLHEWRRVRSGIDSPSLMMEAEATVEALQMTPRLGLEGLVVLVEGEVKGFVLGEKLNDTTSLCHFEKADPFMDGLYQLVDREFSRLCFTECTYVNREQDLGEAGLRHSKLSYHPIKMIRKFRARKAGRPLVG